MQLDVSNFILSTTNKHVAGTKGQRVYVECVQNRDSWEPLFEEIALLLRLFFVTWYRMNENHTPDLYSRWQCNSRSTETSLQLLPQIKIPVIFFFHRTPELFHTVELVSNQVIIINCKIV